MTALYSGICTAGIIIALFGAAAVILGVPARFLMWSVVGHCGLLLAGLGLAGKAKVAAGAEAATLYAASLLVAQSLAWLSWRQMRGAAKASDFSPERGMGRRMPAPAWAFTIGAVGVAGLPPSPGFFARVMLFAAGIQAGGLAGYGAAIACSLQSVAWLAVGLYAVTTVWLGAPPTRPLKPLARAAAVEFAALAVVLVFLGLIPSPLLQLGSWLAYLLGARA